MNRISDRLVRRGPDTSMDATSTTCYRLRRLVQRRISVITVTPLGEAIDH